jgi:pyridoxamine 5'-phosphate oxidase
MTEEFTKNISAPWEPENATAVPADPFSLFASWFADARAAEPVDPNAMTLATVDADGQPSARMVLLKDYDERGFVFYTNLESRKGRALAANPVAALLFYWKSLGRQVRIEGRTEAVSAAESDEYYNSRPYGSRIGAHASQQSRPLESRAELKARVAALQEKYPEGASLPRPAHWAGTRVVPQRIEFWHEGEFRLHSRVVYTRDGNGWKREMLNP